MHMHIEIPDGPILGLEWVGCQGHAVASQLCHKYGKGGYMDSNLPYLGWRGGASSDCRQPSWVEHPGFCLATLWSSNHFSPQCIGRVR